MNAALRPSRATQANPATAAQDPATAPGMLYSADLVAQVEAEAAAATALPRWFAALAVVVVTAVATASAVWPWGWF